MLDLVKKNVATFFSEISLKIKFYMYIFLNYFHKLCFPLDLNVLFEICGVYGN